VDIAFSDYLQASGYVEFAILFNQWIQQSVSRSVSESVFVSGNETPVAKLIGIKNKVQEYANTMHKSSQVAFNIWQCKRTILQ